jgi:hypothetical protein
LPVPGNNDGKGDFQKASVLNCTGRRVRQPGQTWYLAANRALHMGQSRAAGARAEIACESFDLCPFGNWTFISMSISGTLNSLQQGPL